MKLISRNAVILGAALLTCFSGITHGHGLMVDPPARNAVCGLPEDQKPHNATNPACIEAFKNDMNGGYQFMSVLTHDVGRQGVTPLPSNVCGFDSETWDNNNNGNTTPWDVPANWPTSPVSSGPFDITWNISWGPHFDDTEEFVYYITKPGFNFQANTPLKWSDFESTPFCKQTYDDKNPGANPNVVPNKAATTFKTSCSLPNRNGRHVIYGEWGRNFFTFERFHGCIDVTFGGGGGGGPINNPPSANPQSVSVDENGSVAIALSGTDSDGTVQSYAIVNGPGNGSLTGTGSNRVYTPNATYSGSDSFTFRVTDDDGAVSSPATVSITVNPATGGGGNQAPNAAFNYTANNLAVSFDGNGSSDPDNGPQALSYTWDFGDGQGGTGATPSHTYNSAGNYAVELTVSDGADNDTESKTVSVTAGSTGGGSNAKCEYIVSNQWNSGFTGEVRVTNRGTSPISGWSVSWNYNDGTAITNSWNANVVGSGPYTASNLSWNGTIEPGKTASFGFQGTHGGSTAPVTVTGAVCQ